jgi:hypothetical protein
MVHHERLNFCTYQMYVDWRKLPARRREQETGILQIKLKLEGDLLKRFNDIKRKLGLEHDTEVMRWMITHYHEELKPLSK